MDGILVIDKPQAVTSHDIVDSIRKRFCISKVGHAGTLDPQATGVLVILIGKLTKRSCDFTAHDKEYQACLTLGVAPDSQDAQGEIIERRRVADYTRPQLEDAFDQFLGPIKQIPPMFSALKYRGRRLYSLARQGIEVERPPREVYIYELKILKFVSPDIDFFVRCSKGTYVRSLSVDIARGLGSIGHMSSLRRISSGPFTLRQAVSFDKLNRFSIQQFEEALIDENHSRYLQDKAKA